jgi:tetratricopeptide (TPR) repeat protein
MRRRKTRVTQTLVESFSHMDLQHQYEALYREALDLKTKGRLVDAEAVEAKAAELLSELRSRADQNPEDPETATFLLFLAERDWAILGDHPEVQTKIERAISIRENRSGNHDAAVAEALAKLSEFHFIAGRWGEAEPLYRRAIAIYQSLDQKQTLLYSKCEGGLAQCLVGLGRFKEADSHFREAIEVAEAQKEDKRALYFLYIYRAEGLEKLGDSAEAEALRAKAAALLHKNNPGALGFQV